MTGAWFVQLALLAAIALTAVWVATWLALLVSVWGTGRNFTVSVTYLAFAFPFWAFWAVAR